MKSDWFTYDDFFIASVRTHIGESVSCTTYFRCIPGYTVIHQVINGGEEQYFSRYSHA